MNKILLIVAAFLLFNIGYGQQLKTWTGATSTAWDSDTNWSPVGKPTATENVLITNAYNQPVISTAGAACATLELQNSTPGSIVVLTIRGGSFSPSSVIMNSNGGDTSDCSLSIETGRVSVTGNVTMTGTALQNDVTFSGDGNLLIGGIMTGGILNSTGKGTVTYNGTGTRNVGAYNYYNLTLSGSGVRTITSAVNVYGALIMAGSAKASAAPTYGPNAALQYNSGSAIIVGPEWLSPFISKGGVQISTLTSTSTVTINGNGVEKRFNDGVPLIIDEDATLVVNNSDIYFGGDLINNRGSLTTDSYVYLTGNVNQSIDSFTSTKGVAMIKNAGTATFTGNVDTKELIINGLGTLNLGSGWTHTFTDWVRTKGTLNGSSSLLKFSGNVTGTGSDFIPETGTVEFNGGAQNLGTGSITYNNLVLSGAGIKTFGAQTKINDTFSIVSGVVADLTANLVHTAKSIKLGLTPGAGGSWGSSASKAVNKNNTFFASNTGIVNVGPTIVISTDNLPALTTIYGTPSLSNSFKISGIDMLEAVLVTAPAGFEVSKDGITFADTVTVGGAGSFADTAVYVRLKGTIPANNYAGNIVLTSNSTTNVNIAIATSTVNKAPLSITTKDATKVYGSENPALTATYVGFVNGDTEASLSTLPTIVTNAVTGSAVGNYPITASGALSANYTISYGTPNGSLAITAAALTITTNNASKVYGSDNPALTATYVGFVNGDTEASLSTPVKIETTAVKTSAVGNYPITVSGALSKNYTISYGTPNGSLAITAAPLTITTNSATKVYGSENPALTATYVGFVNGDTEASLTTLATIITTAVKTSAVGNYPITVSGALSKNYTISYGTPNGLLAITAAPLTITTNNATKVYGSENPALTATYVGFVNGDTEASLSTLPTIITTAVKTSAVGNYPIAASGAVSKNYTISYGIPNGSLAITAAPLTISTNNATKVYGAENPTLTATYAGFVNGDTEASLSTLPTIITTAVKTSAVGNYPITASGAVSKNYTISYGIPNGSLAITAAPLTITANNATKVFGSENPALTATYVGFVNGDTEASLSTLPTIITTAVKTSAVGNYPITASGAVSKNYTISYGTPNGSLAITAAPLTITTNNVTKVYGAENPALTATYVGFVNGDTEASLSTPVKIETTAVKTSAVGNYPITASGAVSKNYTISYGTPNGSLAITAAPLTITTNNATKVYGSDNPALTATYVGFVNGDTEASLTTPVKIETTAVKTSAVGNYPITASEATSPNYTIKFTPSTLTVIASSNAGMIDLAISEGTLSPAFAEGTKDYTATVPNDVTGITVTPTTADASATITVNGKDVPSGTPSQEIPLQVGENTITTVITAQDGTTNTYTVVVTREKSSNAGMTDLTISQGTLSPAFAEGTKDYTATVPNDVAGITVTPTTADATATITVNGKDVTSGTPSQEIPLQVGENTITTVITAQDGTTNTYTVVVTREESNDAGLTDLTISKGTLSPVFAEGTKDYNATVPNDIASVTVTPTTADATATVTVNGKEVTSGTSSQEITLEVGKNTITTVITAQDGTTNTYTIIVTREASNNSGLTDLAISEGTLSPAFAEGTKDYTATVPNDVAAITVTPTTEDPTATVTVNGKEVPSGTPSAEIPLQVGENTITTVVTAQDGTTNTYVIVVTREEAPASNNAGMTDLTISEGTLSPAFAEGTKDYTAIVPNNVEGITVTPTPADATATVTVNGKEVPSGTPSQEIPLQVGENIITTVITAQDGTTTNTYTIIVTREETPKSDNAGLADLIVSEGTLTPAFDTDTKDYKVDVPNETNSIIVTPITIDPNATVEIKVDGTTVADNTAPIDLKEGDNVITVIVTAEDGTQETYTVIVDRADAPLSDNSGLTDLAISEGTLSPAFAEGTKDYTVTVPNDVAGITVTPTTEDPTATVTINGKEVPSGTPSAEIPLQVGENTITTVVTAQDGTTNTYVIVVTREEAPKSDNAGLSDIVVSEGTLSPAFDTDTKDYKVDVPNETNSIIVTPITIDPNATVEIKVDGITVTDNTAPIDLKEGDNVITIIVTAEDGTQETYVVIVDRADAEPQAVIPTNIITPNGDGKNDFWVIPGIDAYPNNSVKVFDRAARLVYSRDNYNNDWDGTYKGAPLNQDTYYYLIDLGAGLPKIKGFISIIRD